MAISRSDFNVHDRRKAYGALFCFGNSVPLTSVGSTHFYILSNYYKLVSCEFDQLSG